MQRTGSWYETAARNLDIIELARRIEAEQRAATPEEQALLVRYVGFGAGEIRNNLFPVLYDYERREDPPGSLIFPKGVASYHRRRGREAEGVRWGALAERVAALPESWQRSLLQSTQYAHYTSPGVVAAIWRAIERMGFTGGAILEPGMGIGNFPLLMPDGLHQQSLYTGVEMDGPTATIARLLLPRQLVRRADYTNPRANRGGFRAPRDYYDLAIGNPPFSPTKVVADPEYAALDLPLHDFFFAKTLDLVKPGGLLVFVTSRHTLDKARSSGRKYLAERADLVGAVRLPQTAFRENAGTDVVTDVLFFRKRAPGEAPGGAAWQAQKDLEIRNATGDVEGQLRINEYFVDHPEMVLGQTRIGGTGAVDDQGRRIHALHPGDLVVVSYDQDPTELERKFDAAMERLPANIYSAQAAALGAARERQVDVNPQSLREGVLYLDEAGEVRRVEHGVGRLLSDVEPKLKPQDLAWLKDYVRLREAVQAARQAQITDTNWRVALTQLNREYGAFVKQHGHIMAFRTQVRRSTDEDGEPRETLTRVFLNKRRWRTDFDAPLVTQLETISETGEISKGPFLLGRTVARPVTREITSTADALAVSLDARGTLDLADVAQRLGQSVAEVSEQLAQDGLAYETPGGQWQLADEYLSGLVRDKLEEAREAAARDERFARNVTALEAAQPPTLGPQQVTVQLGAGWVPDRYVNQFAEEVLNAGAVTYDRITETWSVAGGNLRRQRTSAAEWGTEDASPSELLEDVLNNRTIRVTRTGPDKKTYTDPTATAQLNELARKMRATFKTWIWTDVERATAVLDIYNDQMNNLALRRFDGEHLTLPGLSLRFTLYPHQKRVIWRMIQTGDTYLAHAVGAGKTMEMIVAGMEQKRLGLIRKPLYVVPNHMLEQFANEFMATYPLANLLVADNENFSKERRAQFAAAAAMNNPDAVIITHSAFKLLSMKEENVTPIRDAILDELRDALADTSQDERVRRSQLERQIESVQRRFDRVMGKSEESALSFEDLGADFLFVDEAHNFRKLDFTTNRQVKGVDPNGSWAAMDLYVKTRYLRKRRPGRAFVMASGTPVTNTVGELYTIQRFFDEEGMKRDSISTFDAWANAFGEVASDFERNAAGRLESVERFAAFSNVPELMNRVRQFMDVLTSTALGDLVKRPDLEGGKPRMVLVNPTPELQRYMQGELSTRLAASKAWKPSKDEPNNPDPVVAIINDARVASIDMRFVQPDLPADTPSKLNALADEVAAEYQATRDLIFTNEQGRQEPTKGGAQLVFFNMGLGAQVQRNRGFNARQALISRIVKGGVPRDKIAWFEDADTDAKKERIFADMRSGKLAVLVGSAKKMGTGVNVQKRLTALQYLDPPWYPADVEQPHGRILRQGNQNDSARINWYSTKETYEATMWAMVARKQRFIDQALSGDASLRRIEDISEASQFEMAAALVSGDPRQLELAAAGRDVERFTLLQESHTRQQVQLGRDLRYTQRDLNTMQDRLPGLERAAKNWGHHQLFVSAEVRGVTYQKRSEAGDALIAAFNGSASRWDKDKDIKIGSVNGKVELAVVPHIRNGKAETAQLYAFFDEQFTALSQNLDVMIPEDTNGGALIGSALEFGNRLGSRVVRERAEIERATAEIAAIKKKLGAPFEYAQELAAATAKLNQLRQELMNEGQAAPTDSSSQALVPVPSDQVATNLWERMNQPRGVNPRVIKELGRVAREQRAREDARRAEGSNPEGSGRAAGKDEVTGAPGEQTNGVGPVGDAETRFRREGGAPMGMSPAAVQAVVKQQMAPWAKAPEVVVFDGWDDPIIPRRVREAYNESEARRLADDPEAQPLVVNAFWSGGKVYVNAAAVKDQADLEQSIRHEVLGHAGLRALFGQELVPILDRLIGARRAEVVAKAKALGLDSTDRQELRQAAEELLADLAMTQPEIGFVRQLLAMIRAKLREWGVLNAERISDEEILREWVIPARNFIERGREAAAGVNLAPAFQRQSEADGAGGVAQAEIGANWRALERYTAQKRGLPLPENSGLKGKKLEFYRLVLRKADYPNQDVISVIANFSDSKTENYIREYSAQPDITMPTDVLEQRAMAKAATQEDQEYLQAVKDGNTDKAQRLVDQAAKAAGFSVTGYHWSGLEFTTFEGGEGFHFGTEQAAYDRPKGQNYSVIIDYSIENDDGAFNVYADNGPKEGDPLGSFATERDARAFIATQPKRIMPRRFFLKLNKPYRAEDQGTSTGWDALIKRIRHQRKGYDGVVYTNVVEDPGSDSYLVWDAKRIKLADAVVYDDGGNVIPLSQRFSSDPDIRFRLTDPADDGGSPLGGGRVWLESVGQALRDGMKGKLEPALAVLTLRQLADVGAKWVPLVKLFDRQRLRMETRRNVMMEEAGRLGDAVDAWARHKSHREEAQRVWDLANAATLAQADPSDYQVLQVPLQLGPGPLMVRSWAATMENVKELRRRVRAWKKSPKVRERELAGYYQQAAEQLFQAVKAERKRQAALPELMRQWEALSSGRQHLGADGQPFATEAEARAALQTRRWPSGVVAVAEAVPGGWALQELGGQQVFTRFRDLYAKRSQEMMEALIARLESLESLDEDDKRVVAAKIRAEFEATFDEKGNPRVGPYFPLQRWGRFFVFARRYADPQQRIYYQDDGSAFASAAAARAALKGMPQLRGANVKVVEAAGGWVLKDVGEEGFWTAEAIGERRKLVAELEAEGWEVLHQGLTAAAHRVLEGVSEGFMAEAIDKLRKKKATEEADTLYQLYLQTLQQMSIRKHFLHRKGTTGFTRDHLRAFGWNMTRLAHQISKLEGLPALEQTLRRMKEELKEQVRTNPGMDTTREDILLEELKRRLDWIANPTNAPVTNWLSALSFVFYLGVSPAAALVNLTQLPIVALPVLAGRLRRWNQSAGRPGGAAAGGVWGEAGRALSTAFFDVARGFKPGVIRGFVTGRPLPSEAANLTEAERAAFAVWDETGARDRTQAHNLAGIGDADNWLNGPTFNRVMGAVSSLFHLAEVVNRDATLLAGYRLARSRGMAHESAVLLAEDATWEAHYDYSNANRARFMQGDVAKVLLQFKNFAQHTLFFLGRNLYLWAKGEDEAVRREARTKFAGMVGMTSLFAGAAGLPIGGAFVVANALQAMFGDDDEPWDAETEWRNLLAKTFPGVVADVIDRGAVNTATGLDFASRVSIGDLLWRSPDRDLDGAGMFQHIVEQMLGPMGGIAARPFTMLDEVREGHWSRAAEAVVPKFMRDMIQAGRFGAEGVLTRQGDPIMQPGELNSWELWWKANGFTPDDLAVKYDSNKSIKLYERRIMDRRRALLTATALALMAKDAEAIQAARRQVAVYNRAHPEYKIEEATIRRSIKARQQMRERAEDGIIVNPKLSYLRSQAGGYGQ